MMWLAGRIIRSGEGVLDDEYEMVYFPGDDLFAVARPRGFPIGNLTSQFWSNVYLTPLDWFVTRDLKCPAYLRYVDDFAFFSDSKRQLYEWKQAVIEFLRGLRLTIHEPPAGHSLRARHSLAGLCRISDSSPRQIAQRRQIHSPVSREPRGILRG